MSNKSQKRKVVVHDWSELDDLKSKRIWHQLSLKVLEIAKSPECETEEVAKELYSTYIQGREKKMNQTLVVEILYYLGDHYENPEEAISLLENAEEKMSPPTDEAVTLCKILTAEILFSRMNDMEQCKLMLDEAEAQLDGIPVSEKVHGRYYLLSYKWHKKQGDHSQMYRNGLRYLGIVDVDALPLEERISMSRDLAMAAIIAEDVYHIGELICNPVCTSLKESEQCSWLYDLLLRMESGRLYGVQCFQKRCRLQAPELTNNWPAIQQKSRLLSLVQKFNTGSRRQYLEEIGNEMKIPSAEVEGLLMTAMAKGLIKGQIDEESGVVSVSWVQPKVLSKSQLKLYALTIDEWMEEVKELEVHISEPETEYPETTLPRVPKPSQKQYNSYNF